MRATRHSRASIERAAARAGLDDRVWHGLEAYWDRRILEKRDRDWT
ncbi:MAG: hypothetical protein ACYDDF_00360 [Thermoplasmatota archaeon]